ncbi:MAG: tryptophan--tRNA ligase [Bacillaceae bacterium]|nr:tryptophan--tRNA ligase [Bacillaceae bacterium]
MKRVFSGVQPTGTIHLGNYLGAMKRFVDLQDDYESIFCIVDLHALTVPRDPEELRNKTRELALFYLAIGLDPEKTTIFTQSSVSAHSELAWLLQCVAHVGELNRMTQYKEKGQGKDTVTAGLYTYPVLMAADILLYQTEVVPVGEDQKQHLELTRDIAQRFNNRYGEAFTIPEPLINEIGARIMALDEPTKKMSKSAESPNNYIGLLEEPKIINKKIMRAVTDSENEVRFDPENKPGISNLLTIYSLMSETPVSELEQKYQGLGYGAFKKDLAEVVVDRISEIQDRYRRWEKDGGVEDVLRQGAEKVSVIAEETMERVKDLMGLYRV